MKNILFVFIALAFFACSKENIVDRSAIDQEATIEQRSEDCPLSFDWLYEDEDGCCVFEVTANYQSKYLSIQGNFELISYTAPPQGSSIHTWMIRLCEPFTFVTLVEDDGFIAQIICSERIQCEIETDPCCEDVCFFIPNDTWPEESDCINFRIVLEVPEGCEDYTEFALVNVPGSVSQLGPTYTNYFDVIACHPDGADGYGVHVQITNSECGTIDLGVHYFNPNLPQSPYLCD